MPRSAAVGLLAALALGRPALAALSVPFAVVLGVAVAASPRPELRIDFSLDTARMLEGGTIGAQLDVQADGPAEWVELELVLPEGVSVGRRRRPDRVPARRRGEPAPRLRARVRALGCLPDRARRRADPERVRPALDDGADRRRAAASRLPSPGTTAPRRAGVRHDPVLRQPGVPGQGGGNRVRRYPPVRAPATASAGSTGGRAPAASGCTSTRATPSARAT